MITGNLLDHIVHPLAILEGTKPNSSVVLADIGDGSRKRVIAAIHLDRKQNRLDVNQAASLYGKKNLNDYVARNISVGKLLYLNTKKASEWFTSEGLQLPKLVQTNTNANNIIAPDDRLSNSLFDSLTPEQRTKLLGDGQNRRYQIRDSNGPKSSPM